MENYIDYLKEGSGIHIKKKNRGKFTDYCGGKVTAECIARGKKSPSATIRKRATFAANARKWKHEEGGVIKAAMGTELPFIGLPSKKKNDKEYKITVQEILKDGEIKTPEITLPEEQETEVKTPAATTEKTDWTAGYRIGEGTSETIPATTKITATTVKPDMSKVRSDRNNNPLNIRYDKNINWEGKVKAQDRTDDAFEEFISRDYGWRAAYRNLNTKMRRGVNTIRKLISEWAPPAENNTILYIKDVSTMTGIDPDAIISLDDRELMPKLGAAMAAIEANRKNQINWQDALNGFEFYLNSKPKLTV